ncbi:MAG: FG-GAP repeat domain-containing protein, partial [Planctomycetota bacterium]
MDYDGDGHLDFVSGSYDPGEIYLFRGEGGGKYRARETIVDRSEKPVLFAPEQKHPVESFGSWVALVDWEGDGDLDVLLGNFGGAIVLRVNEGTRAQPAYATRHVDVRAGGKPLVVPDGHANPVVADWDGDGRWDILSGSANGGVYWYRNAGK